MSCTIMHLRTQFSDLHSYLFICLLLWLRNYMWTRNHKMHSICTPKCHSKYLQICIHVVTCIVIIKKSERTCNYVSNGGPKNIHKLVGWTCISIAGSCMLSIFWSQQNFLKNCIIMHRYNNKIAYWESILLPS